jgi:copper transport protein
VVVLTGLIRAIDEVEGWSELFGTLFGRLVVVKVVLLGVLAALGATNRYRSVAAAERSLHGLRRIGGTELAVAAIVLATTAVLSQLVPPATTGSASATGVTVTGSDFAQTVRARLTLTPGTPGTNLFTVQLEDHHTGAPIEASRVELTLRMPSRPDIPPGTVRLTREDPGTYRATATDVAVAGDWLVTVVVGDGTEVTDVELTVPIHPSGAD